MKDLSKIEYLAAMIELGHANAESLSQLHRWCEHLDTEWISFGLVSSVSGLPVGAIRLTCQHGSCSKESVSLPGVTRAFLDTNCRNCVHRKPAGDSTWGQNLLVEIERERTEWAKREEQNQTIVEELHRQRQLLEGSKYDSPTEEQILQWSERILTGQDSNTGKDSAQNLAEAAKSVPGRFGENLVRALCAAASFEAMQGFVLPTLLELARHRPDLSNELRIGATKALTAGSDDQRLWAIIARTRPEWSEYESGNIFEQLTSGRNQARGTEGWPKRGHAKGPDYGPPEDSFIDEFVAQEYDRNQEVFMELFTRGLWLSESERYFDVCEIAQCLMRLRPKIANEIATAVVMAWELSEGEFARRTMFAQYDLLTQAFLADPVGIDSLLGSRLLNGSVRMQQKLVYVYDRAVHNNYLKEEDDDEEDECDLGKPNSGEKVQLLVITRIAVARILGFLQTNPLDLGLLQGCAGLACHVSQRRSALMIEYLDALLHGMAHLLQSHGGLGSPLERTAPEDSPSAPLLVWGKNRTFEDTKESLTNCLEKLIHHHREQCERTLLDFFDKTDSAMQAPFKAEIVSLLGSLADDFDLLPRVLPSLWLALTDSVSELVRSQAIWAIADCTGRMHYSPPANVASMVIQHLYDPHPTVHNAAASILENCPWRLTTEQVHEALNGLEMLVDLYKDKGPDAPRVFADSLLDVSRRLPQREVRAAMRVTSLLPRGEESADREWVSHFAWHIRPAEPVARVLACAILDWVAEPDSHRERSQRELLECFTWLHEIPPALYWELRPMILRRASKAAMFHCNSEYFASLFAAFADYEGECEYWRLVCTRLRSEPQFERLLQKFEKLAEAASRNVRRAKRKEPQWNR